jgi:hypothetical protein
MTDAEILAIVENLKYENKVLSDVRAKTAFEAADAITYLRAKLAERDALGAVVMRDSLRDTIKVGDKAFSLRRVAQEMYDMAVASGSDNPGFDTPGWLYSGSPYGLQIVALGCPEIELPDGFTPEYVPDLGKCWRARLRLWDMYIRFPLPTHAETLAHALTLPEIKALVETSAHINQCLRDVTFSRTSTIDPPTTAFISLKLSGQVIRDYEAAIAALETKDE